MDIRQIIKKYENLLKEDKYDELFKQMSEAERQELLPFLYNQCGVDVLASMTSIPSRMFKDIQGISNINVPENITSIGDAAFAGSSISKIRLPNTISRLPSRLFQNCFNLHKIFIPDSVNEFSYQVFEGTPDDILIGANFRSEQKDKFKFPSNEEDFYRKHLKFIRSA